MPRETRVLTYQQAQAFYNWMGKKQDWQAFYEAPATRALILSAAFEKAQAVFEFGCGTGAFAERLLDASLPPEARYLALDSSATMTDLARTRLARFGGRAQVWQTDGSLQFEGASGTYDRFVSTYVVDLLSLADIASLLAEAHRLLMPDGLLCLVNLTYGTGGLSHLITSLWSEVHRLKPALVGGCRPLSLRDWLPAQRFQLEHVQRVTAFGIPSEIIVAKRRSEVQDTRG